MSFRSKITFRKKIKSKRARSTFVRLSIVCNYISIRLQFVCHIMVFSVHHVVLVYYQRLTYVSLHHTGLIYAYLMTIYGLYTQPLITDS